MMAKEVGENMTGATARRPVGGCVLFICCLILAGGRAEADTEYCNEVRAMAATDQPDRPNVLFELALCSHWPMPAGADGRRRADESLISGLKETLALAPDHEAALDFLVHKVLAIGYGHGVDAASLAGYATTLYGITGHLDAAEAVQQAALDAGDPGKAEAIRDRVRRDLGLDTLDYGPQRRQESLTLACSEGLFRLELEDFCLSALEMLAGNSAKNGEAIPRDVLGHIGAAFRLLRFEALLAGTEERNEREPFGDRLVGARETKLEARLQAILDAYPETLRSSEHYRAYAVGAPTWRGRIASLRRAVDVDGGNLAATCDLAVALTATGSLDEARALYAELAAADDQACRAEEALRDIDFLESSSYKGAGLDDPLR